MALVKMNFFDNAVEDFFDSLAFQFWEDRVINAKGIYQCALSLVAPVISDVSWTSTPEIARANGYFNGAGEHLGNRYVFGHDLIQVGNISTMTGVKISQLAVGGSIGPFRYITLFRRGDRRNVCFWDHGSEVTILDGLTHEFFFNASPDVGTIFTLRTLEV